MSPIYFNALDVYLLLRMLLLCNSLMLRFCVLLFSAVARWAWKKKKRFFMPPNTLTRTDWLCTADNDRSNRLCTRWRKVLKAEDQLWLMSEKEKKKKKKYQRRRMKRKKRERTRDRCSSAAAAALPSEWQWGVQLELSMTNHFPDRDPLKKKKKKKEAGGKFPLHVLWADYLSAQTRPQRWPDTNRIDPW